MTTLTHDTTQTEANKALAKRFVNDIFAKGDTDAIGELVAPAFTSSTFGITEDGPTQLKAATKRVHASLEDVEFTIDDIVAEGDRVAVRLTSSATPTGEWMGVKDAAGKRYTISEAHFFRIADGRVVEHWHQHDAMGLTKQLAGSLGP